MKNLLILLTVFTASCSFYQVEPDWDADNLVDIGCWHYGVISEHFPVVDPLTIPVFKLSNKGMLDQCHNLRGCYIKKPWGLNTYMPPKMADYPYVVLPVWPFSGNQELQHELCHSTGSKHCPGAFKKNGAYLMRIEECGL